MKRVASVGGEGANAHLGMPGDKRLCRIEGCDALMCEDTFAYVIILNGNSLQGMRHDSRSLTREHPVTSSDRGKTCIK